MAVDLKHRYSNESERANLDIYDSFNLKKTLWSPWFSQKYFSVARVNRVNRRVYSFVVLCSFCFHRFFLIPLRFLSISPCNSEVKRRWRGMVSGTIENVNNAKQKAYSRARCSHTVNQAPSLTSRISAPLKLRTQSRVTCGEQAGSHVSRRPGIAGDFAERRLKGESTSSTSIHLLTDVILCAIWTQNYRLSAPFCRPPQRRGRRKCHMTTRPT